MSNPAPAARIYEGLIERLEKGEGSDRELDGEIMFTLFAKPVGDHGYLWPEDDPSWSFAIRFPGKDAAWLKDVRKRNDGETILVWREGDPILMNALRVPALTKSLDAALSLVERMLPGWQATSYFDSAELISPETGGPSYNGLSRNRARALLVALLRALQENPHGK